MTSQDGRDLVKVFFSDLDERLYRQPLVADAIVVSDNDLDDPRNPRGDLNVWRMRGLIPQAYWHKNGRVTFNGRGVLFCALLSELAWTLGPQRGAEAAEVLMSYVDRIAEMIAADDFSFAGDVLRFGRQIPAKGEWNNPRIFYRDTPRTLGDALGLPLHIYGDDQIAAEPGILCARTSVVVPIGRILFNAAFRAEMALREA